jgi:hypothetical protein
MTKTPFRQTLQALFDEFLDLRKRRDEIDARMAQVSEAIEALAKVCEDTDERQKLLDTIHTLNSRVGFTEAVRLALAMRHPSQPGMTPVEIRDFIQNSETMHLSGYSNPLASIHTTLRRMKDIEEEDGRFRLKQQPSATQRLAYKGTQTPARNLIDVLLKAQQTRKDPALDPDKLPADVKAALLGKAGKK